MKVGDDVKFTYNGRIMKGVIVAFEGSYAKVAVRINNINTVTYVLKDALNKVIDKPHSQATNNGTATDAKHYQKAAMQPIEVMQQFLTKEEFTGFLKGNVIKYIARAMYKGTANADMNKANQYAYWLALVEAGVTINAKRDVLPRDFKMETTFEIIHNYSDSKLIYGKDTDDED